MTLARPGGPADAIAGVVPRQVLTPSDTAEAVELVQASAAAGTRLAFVGGGTDLELGGAPRAIDALVRTERLTRVLEHSPADQIVSVEAGLTLAALQARLAAHRQRLAIDPPLPERATLGGIIAANAFGPRRTRFGSIRDLIIGIGFVRADGGLVHGGGKVVKNVAGFDLPKLLVGSLGTLGLIVSATFRLHPLPEASLTVALDRQSPAQLWALVARLRAAQLEPSAVAALAGDGGFAVGVRFEGFAAGVAAECDRLLALGAAAGMPGQLLDEPAAAAFWSRHDALRRAGSWRAKLAVLPTAIEPLANQVLPPLFEQLPEPSFIWYPTLGLGFLGGDASVGATSAVVAARRRLEELGGWMTMVAAPAELRPQLDVWGPPPSAFGVMQNLKLRFDPDQRLNPGRFVGGL